jgi:hypothetical protein
MKKLIMAFITSASISTAFACVPYCDGTTVEGNKDLALQHVVTAFAKENNCDLGTNCLMNFNTDSYSIAWAEACDGSAHKGNDPLGSTFICEHHTCRPLGFFWPIAVY